MATKYTLIMLAAAFVALIAIIPQAQAVHHTDCMKNPFASGCRGISAKRASWPFTGANLAGAADQRQQIPANYLIDGDDASSPSSPSSLSSVRSLWPTSKQTQANPPVWRHSASNLGAAELLIAAANRLLREPADANNNNNINNQRIE